MTADVDADLAELALLSQQWSAIQDRAARERDDTVAQWTRRLGHMHSTQASIAAEGRWTSGPSNLMAVLGLTRAEVANCKVVRWLFDPLARHGLGASMLTRLADHLDVTIDDPTLVRAVAEVAIENTRADIVLSGTRPGASIVIEAKVDAGEQPRQGARLEELWPSADMYVFLTTGGTRIPFTASDVSRWRPLSWAWLANTAEIALSDAPQPADQRARDARAAVAAWLTSARNNLT